MAAQYPHHVWQILVDLAPWLLGGLLVAGLLHGLLPHDFIRRHLGRNQFASVGKAVLLGVPIPLCSCGVIPVALGIKKQGASDGAAIGFLISTPQTGVDSIFVSAAFLGWPFALFKVFNALLTGLIGGILVHVSTPASEQYTNATYLIPEKRSGMRNVFISAINELLYMIWIWILVGIMISAAISTWVPRDYFSSTVLGGAAAPLVVLLISLPLYVCTTSSVPIAAALVAAGMPPGAALVFLMAGPASNAATLGAVCRGFGARILGIYIATVTLSSLGLAYTFDFILEFRYMPIRVQDHHGSPVGTGSALILIALMVRFAVRDLGRWWNTRQFMRKHPRSVKISVAGMTCGDCADQVQSILEQQPGVTTAVVDLKSGIALFEGEYVDVDSLNRAIQEAGFYIALDPLRTTEHR